MMEIIETPWRSEASLLRFGRAPVVGVPITEVANTSVQWLLSRTALGVPLNNWEIPT
jgi:hypothetical protein